MRPSRLPATTMLLGCLALATACASPGGTDLDLDGAWRLSEATVDDAPVELPEGAEVTLEVEDGEAAGTGGCNQYGASVTVDGDTVAFGQARRTLMACEEPLMTLEDTYLRALAQVDSGERDGDSLALTGPGVRLVYLPS